MPLASCSVTDSAAACGPHRGRLRALGPNVAVGVTDSRSVAVTVNVAGPFGTWDGSVEPLITPWATDEDAELRRTVARPPLMICSTLVVTPPMTAVPG